MSSAYANGGIIGQTLDFADAAVYVNSSLAINFDGINSSNVFTDISGNNLQLTAFGNAQISTTQSKFGVSSGYFDGTGDYLQIPYNVGLDLIGSSFTIEGWIYPTTIKTTGTRIFSTGGGTVAWSGTTGIHILLQIVNAAGNLQLQMSTNTATPISVLSNVSIPINTWTHIAVVYNSSSSAVTFFINGILQTVSITAPSRPSTNPITTIGTIYGEAGAASQAFQGYIDDLKISKNRIVYTSNFSVPTASSITIPNKKNSGVWDLPAVLDSIYNVKGQQAYTTPGTYSWTAPAGVTSVSVVCVGGGGGGLYYGTNSSGYTYPMNGGTGGGLGWKNNIPVVPGTSYTVVIGAGGLKGVYPTGSTDGGSSYFVNTSTVAGFGGIAGRYTGSASGGSFVGAGGGAGGAVISDSTTAGPCGGGGAGGYIGAGGATSPTVSYPGNGGGGGGGNVTPTGYSGGGGGVGILGQGASGSSNGGAGSSGTAGVYSGNGTGGSYGGGGGGASSIYWGTGGNGGSGAVRIIWGTGRSFPSTGTVDV